VSKARELDDVIVATDDARIQAAAEGFGARVVLTSRKCRSGTDRLAEVARKLPAAARIFINIQGDEPLIAPALIDALAAALRAAPGVPVVTAAYPLKDEREFLSPNVVKVVVDREKHALYFSRSPLPCRRSKSAVPLYKHLGIYGYRRDFLLRFAAWPQTPLEKAEQLEQLRVLEKGYRMKVVISGRDSYGVDVPADVVKIERLLNI
jgi:3-deoxy-manno-octulosonate cytidylyltransferase (CMP-KDO synthetase)